MKYTLYNLQTKTMNKLSKSQTIGEIFKKSEYPELYSKRGFEKNRIKVIIPKDSGELAIIKTPNQIINELSNPNR